MTLAFQLKTHVRLLILAPENIGPDAEEKYFQWVDEHVLSRIRDENPELYSWIIERIKEIMTQLAEMTLLEELE